MASSTCSSNLLLNPISRRSSPPLTTAYAYKLAVQCRKSAAPPLAIRSDERQSRRQLLFLTTAITALNPMPSMAEDIGLFGLRKKLKKAEEEAEEIVKEGFESAEKGLEAAERGIEAAERGIEAAETEVATEVRFGGAGGLAQAGVVVGAEVVGVLVATSVVNGILGPES